MKRVTRLFFLFILAGFHADPALSQSPDSIRPDYNPRLTNAEAEWLNTHIPDRGDFDFKGKNVAFAELLTGGFYGIGKFTLPLHQKYIFIPGISESFHKLFILTEEEKKQTAGLDAIFVLGNSKHKGKMRRLKRNGLLSYYSNNYPQIPDDAGKDDSPLLSSANAVFFNEVYRYYPDRLPQPFDFTGKKVAIFSRETDIEKVRRIPVSSYVQYVRDRLDESGRCSPEFTYLLTPEQKTETGGYDVVISYRNKIGAPVQGLIDKLKKEYEPQ
ncbi:hypothetical protein LZZ85_03430 [Terrimonas sp. NA20]|uniref:DUF8192 domain-containing protein n=1 Tax=Terrimonas ginsenosidimutans TaxID=2908004 RepID=A0ABS9KLV9_9BACT|nr:hypothetical protein [Terrimonas ginsenosidimutans]MCG2613311.1 hypothetical protein [Terrimonas ginsenosidimutans]